MFGGRKTQTQQTAATPSPGQPTPSQGARQPVGFETVLGANTTLKGDLTSKANVRIDGTFDGGLEIEGNILIGETAHVTADIHARNITIAGAVRGDVSGQKVVVARTGRVWGDIHATALTTEEGAFIDGKITMIGHPALTQGFEPASLPAPGISVLRPTAEDANSGEPVEAELMDDDSHSRRGVSKDKTDKAEKTEKTEKSDSKSGN